MHLYIPLFVNVGESPEKIGLTGKIFSYLVADTQERNEGDEDRTLVTVNRLLVGGELCDPYIVNGTTESDDEIDGDSM